MLGVMEIERVISRSQPGCACPIKGAFTDHLACNSCHKAGRGVAEQESQSEDGAGDRGNG